MSRTPRRVCSATHIELRRCHSHICRDVTGMSGALQASVELALVHLQMMSQARLYVLIHQD